MASARVVAAYLEDISIQAFEHHPDELNKVIGEAGGIYGLYKNDRLYYVGLATNLFRRINQHRKDKHRGKWNRFSAYLTKRDHHIKEMESLTLRILSPHGNTMTGRLTGSDNLKRELIKLMKHSAQLHDAEILGGADAKHKRKRAAHGSKGSKALSALAGHRRRLWGSRNGVDYDAVLLKSGQISFKKQRYESPSAAAFAAIGRGTNGWMFWHYYIGKGEWKPLKNLK
jgi:hypothetical protein